MIDVKIIMGSRKILLLTRAFPYGLLKNWQKRTVDNDNVSLKKSE